LASRHIAFHLNYCRAKPFESSLREGTTVNVSVALRDNGLATVLQRDENRIRVDLLKNKEGEIERTFDKAYANGATNIYRIILANGGIHPRFPTVTPSEFMTADLAYDPDTITSLETVTLLCLQILPAKNLGCVNSLEARGETDDMGDVHGKEVDRN
jgi:hypothetical protein